MEWYVGGAVRALRRRAGLTQAELAARIGCSHDLISRIELDRCDGVPIGRLRDCVEALGAHLRVDVRWQGERLPRLLDARHAALQNHAASLLVHWGWLVRPEVSFNHFGDRGRVDLVAYHEPTRTAAMVEVKPALGDIQDTLGRLDVKARLGRRIALSVGWQAAIVIPMLILGEGSTQRRQVRMHEALFSGFVTGRAAMTWLRQPTAPHPAALLVFATADSPHAARVGSVVLPADGVGRW